MEKNTIKIKKMRNIRETFPFQLIFDIFKCIQYLENIRSNYSIRDSLMITNFLSKI